jgi:deazaflavin-dependent oxidoreductase (nitroreductase family)
VKEVERSMFELVALILGFVLVSAATLGFVFIIGMRRKSPLVLRAVIWISKVYFNKSQMRTAGTPGAYAAIIRHRGRVSGMDYETPVGAVVTDDGFLIILPYGRTSWARNVLASGTATLVHEGRTYDVDSPEIVPLASLASALSSSDQRMARIFRVTDALRLRRVHAVELASAA